MGNALVCAVPICRPVQAVQIGALPCGFHASSATGGAWSPPHEQKRPGYHDGRSLRRGAEAAGRAAHRHRRRGGKGRLTAFRNFILIKRRAFALLFIWEYFALRRDLLLSTVTKVGKSTGRNLRFLHFRARYGAYRIVSTYHTFTQDFLFRFVKRIVSASAPLPLISAPNSAFGSTVENVSGSGARRKSMRHTKRNQLCSVNVWLIVTNLQKEQRAGSPET